MENNVRRLPIPEQLTNEQYSYWRSQAEYWSEQASHAVVALDYANGQLVHAQRVLGEVSPDWTPELA